MNFRALVLGGVLLLLVALPVALNRPRGIRNNNPGNLRPLDGGQKWMGQVGVDTAPGGPFVVFGQVQEHPGEYWGLRALARTLLNYQRNRGLVTVRAMMHRYAPSTDANNPDRYAAFVAREMGLPSPDVPVDLVNSPQLHRDMTRAVVRYENGIYPYSDVLLASAVSAARA